MLLEEKANATYGVYIEQVKTKEKLLAENVIIEEDKKALIKQIDAEQGNMSQYHEKQAKISAQKADLEGQLVESQDLLVKMESSRVSETANKKSLELECTAVKKDIDDIDMAIRKLEQEKTNRDHSIRSLNDEIANQDEIINKLNKEKKHISENSAKASEDLQGAGDKVEHLNKIKQKLESTLDELESSFEKEKRSRANIEKERRKIEGELKVTQETVSELERSKKELEAHIARKEKELEAERQARAKAERQRSDLAREMESLGERLNEASGATSAQVELNKKRESEVTKLRKDLEECN